MTETKNAAPKLKRFLRIKQVSEVTALPPSTIYEKMAEGLFPKNYPLTPRIKGWDEEDIAKWQAARIAERG
jgi:prophage regulatory protein